MSGGRDRQQDQKPAQSAEVVGGTRKRRTLTQEVVRERFDYDPDTGSLYWRTLHKKSNGRVKVGDRVRDNLSNAGYKLVYVEGSTYLQHRVIWLWWNGFMPEHEIDHINRIRTDNRIGNLREVSHACNSKNCTLSSSNQSGVCGVHFNSRTRRWYAQIYHPPMHRIGIGGSRDFVEAVALRLAAEQCLGWGSCDNLTSAAAFMQKYQQENL